jgi:hypothetical protein
MLGTRRAGPVTRMLSQIAARWWGRQDQHELAEAKVTSEGSTVRIAVILKSEVVAADEGRRYIGAIEVDRAELLGALGLVNKGTRPKPAA